MNNDFTNIAKAADLKPPRKFYINEDDKIFNKLDGCSACFIFFPCLLT